MSEELIKHDFKAWVDQTDMPNGKRKVILAALKLFAEQGFDGTSTQQIATESGMSQATIFKYFKSKEDLLDLIIGPIMQNLLPIYVNDFKKQLVNKHVDLRATIHFVVRNRFQFLVDNQEVALIILSELLTKNDLQKAFKEMLKTKGVDIVENFSKMLTETEEVRDDVDVIAIIRLIISQVLVYFLQNYKLFETKSDAEMEKDLDQIEDLVYRAISK